MYIFANTDIFLRRYWDRHSSEIWV